MTSTKSRDTTPAGPLAGLTVVDASTIVAGPLAAAILGDYGARVIKVENPDGGDNARRLGKVVDGHGAWWTFLSRNKKCVTCNMTTPEGAELFLALIKDADVLIENFRPGKLEKWGLSPERLLEVNPRLVILRISGFGQDGPYASRPGYGTVAEAMSGFVNLMGFPDGPPFLPGVPVADSGTGFLGAYSCMVALWGRNSTGRGSVIDLSLYAPMLQTMGPHLTGYQMSGEVEGRGGNRMGTTPRNAHQCSDGKWIAYSGQSPNIIAAMVKLFDLGGNPRFADTSIALRNGLELDDMIGEWMSTRTRAEVVEAFIEAGIPIGPVLDDADVMDDPHFLDRREFLDFEHAGRQIRMPALPFRLSGAEPREGLHITSPSLGEHNLEIYDEFLGLDATELDRLARAGTI